MDVNPADTVWLALVRLSTLAVAMVALLLLPWPRHVPDHTRHTVLVVLVPSATTSSTADPVWLAQVRLSTLAVVMVALLLLPWARHLPDHTRHTVLVVLVPSATTSSTADTVWLALVRLSTLAVAMVALLLWP